MSQEPTRWSERHDLPELSQSVHAARSRLPDPALLEKILTSVEAAAAAPAAASGAAWKTSLGAKLALVGAGLGAAGAVVWLNFAAPSSPKLASRPVPSAVARTSAPVPSSALVPQSELPSHPPAPVPSVNPLPVKPKPPAPASPSSSASTPSELELIRAARATLGSDPARALALTQQHAQAYPGGALVQEREVLAIEALVRLGQATTARQRAEAFAAAHPESAYVPRLERSVGALKEGQEP
jgi:hypothetical protein